MRYYKGEILKNRVSLEPYGAPNFYLDEFIHPDWYFRPGNSIDNMIEWLVKSRLHLLAQMIRFYFDCPCRINNWARYGLKGRVNSGLRTIESPYAKFSWHQLGGAIDMQVIRNGTRLTSETVQRELLGNGGMYELLLDFGVKEIEDPSIAKTWLHICLMGTDTGKIKIIGG